MREIGLSQNIYIQKEYPDNLGKRTKLGGKPEWIQDPEVPLCMSCQKNMIFISQLDSIDYGEDIDKTTEYIFGDMGMIYTFFCFDCLDTKSVFQTY